MTMMTPVYENNPNFFFIDSMAVISRLGAVQSCQLKLLQKKTKTHHLLIAGGAKLTHEIRKIWEGLMA